MSHPYSGNKASDVAKRRAGKMASGGSVDGKIKKAVSSHESRMHGESKSDMGVPGEYARGGRARKGGKGKKKGGDTKINIAIIGGEKKGEGAGLPPPPMGAMMPPPPPPGGPGPMAGPPGGMPPGAMPPPDMPPKPPGMMNRGGKVPMKGGAESGVGRLDKAKAYKKG